jgi:hypothetical protein
MYNDIDDVTWLTAALDELCEIRAAGETTPEDDHWYRGLCRLEADLVGAGR